MKKLVDVLESGGPVSLKSLEELVDLDAFITFWAATVLTSSADSYIGGANNYYVYRDAKSAKFYLIPWGADAWTLAAGDRGKEVPKSVWADGLLCRRLWELPEIREKYRTEMRRLLADVWDEKSLLGQLDQVRRLCQDELPDKRVENVLPLIIRFIEGRRETVQAELDRPAQDWPLPRRDAALELKKQLEPREQGEPSVQVEGSFTAVVAELFPTNAIGYYGRGNATLQFAVHGETRKPFAQSGAVAVMKRALGNENRIRIAVADAAGDLGWQITFSMDPYRAPVAPGMRELGGWSGVGGAVLQGEPSSPKRQWRGGGKGMLELTQVSTNLGGTISGKFKINTTPFEEKKP